MPRDEESQSHLRDVFEELATSDRHGPFFQCRCAMIHPDTHNRIARFRGVTAGTGHATWLGMNAFYDMVDGYCFELLRSDQSLRLADDDDWDTGVYAPDGRERFTGYRSIDGVVCAVFRCRDRRYRAQLLAACRRSA